MQTQEMGQLYLNLETERINTNYINEISPLDKQ